MVEALAAITNELPVPESPKRLAIIDAATRLFVGAGFGATSMDAIAAEANVSKRTVYSHFENKEALFAGVMEGMCARQKTDDVCPLNCGEEVSSAPPEVMLKRMAVHLLTMITSAETNELFRVVMGEAGRFPELGRTFYDNGPGWVIAAVTDYVKNRNAEGVMDVADPELAGRQYLALVVDPLKLELTLGIKQPPTAVEIEQVADDAVCAFMKIYS